MRTKWILMVIALALILVFAAAPIISIVIAGAIAGANGCNLHEGFSNPCVIGGTDHGDTLYAMGVMGWFMLVTIPVGLVALVIWLVVAVSMAATDRKVKRA